MDALSLVRLHLQLECVGIDAKNQLFRLPCPNPDTLHRVYGVRFTGGQAMFFQQDVPDRLREQLGALPLDIYFDHPEYIKRLLSEHAPCTEVFIGKSYIFPREIDRSEYPNVVRLSQIDPVMVRQYDPDIDLSRCEVFGALVDGQIVSTCESSRENGAAGEAWVRTLAAYRRRGYARQATLAWADSLKRQGKTPFYSHLWENQAYQALAESLGLLKYIEDAGYA